MSKIRIILAESSDIMLDGLHKTLLCDQKIIVKAKATRYNVLCRMIERINHDLVVLGPMISQRYTQDLKTSLLVKYPGIRLVEIAMVESKEGLLEKIEEAIQASIC